MRIIVALLAFMLSFCVVKAQDDNVAQKMNSGDNVTVHLKFGKLPPSETQPQVNALLQKSVETTEVLSSSIVQLTTALNEGIQYSKEPKLDRLANQSGISKNDIYKAYNRNNHFKLIAVVLAFLTTLYAICKFVFTKGLDVDRWMKGTALLALYAIVGAILLYATLSLLFNSQLFTIKEILTLS
jgi:DNA-binding phage protein